MFPDFDASIAQSFCFAIKSHSLSLPISQTVWLLITTRVAFYVRRWPRDHRRPPPPPTFQDPSVISEGRRQITGGSIRRPSWNTRTLRPFDTRNGISRRNVLAYDSLRAVSDQTLWFASNTERKRLLLIPKAPPTWHFWNKRLLIVSKEEVNCCLIKMYV